MLLSCLAKPAYFRVFQHFTLVFTGIYDTMSVAVFAIFLPQAAGG
jgi:hypothetical protein